jgi:hypothetical protein
MDIQKIIAAIDSMDRDEVRAVGLALKDRREILDNRKKRKLSVGSPVKFKGKYNVVTEGTVVKINRKTVHIKVGSGINAVTWRVAPVFIIDEDE